MKGLGSNKSSWYEIKLKQKKMVKMKILKLLLLKNNFFFIKKNLKFFFDKKLPCYTVINYWLNSGYIFWDFV